MLQPLKIISKVCINNFFHKKHCLNVWALLLLGMRWEEQLLMCRGESQSKKRASTLAYTVNHFRLMNPYFFTYKKIRQN